MTEPTALDHVLQNAELSWEFFV